MVLDEVAPGQWHAALVGSDVFTVRDIRQAERALTLAYRDFLWKLKLAKAAVAAKAATARKEQSNG
jgi:hypothetical protein